MLLNIAYHVLQGKKIMALGKKALPYSSASRHGPGRKSDSQKSKIFSMLAAFPGCQSPQVLNLKH